MKRAAAGLLLSAFIALGVFGAASAEQQVQCFAWGGMQPVPSSEYVHQQYVQVNSMLPSPEARALLAKVITRCTNEDPNRVGIGVCIPPDPNVPCQDPT